MVAVILSQYLLQVISLMMVGHLGELALSSTAIAISLSGVTGFSFLLGMASALETLCGQAYGAEQYHKLGTQTYTAIVSLLLVCLPLAVIWLYMSKLLTFIGQDPVISHEAGQFSIWLVPALFGYATLQALVRTLLLVRKLVSRFQWRYLEESESFFRFAIPSAVMICLEWWSFELLILLSGLLPNPELEASVLSVCLNTVSTLYAIPHGLGSAGSTRVSNELGAGNPQKARLAVHAAVCLAVTEAIVISTTLFVSRRVFGYVFSEEEEVVDYVTNIAPFLCLSVILDSVQGTLSGENFFFPTSQPIPLAVILAFVVHLRGKGLWVGLQTGSLLQTSLLLIITGCTNWEEQATKARQRIFEGTSSVENGVLM
ncbi:Protein detoxification 12 [Vitis vinifera]|uniref:Protein detoxification 12 n=1 Tax=Vitis vinifera TaxID=29760 RepID=A0A438C1B4_VITVI|nr:Protein detoxification 12 [Vitis vinifera]